MQSLSKDLLETIHQFHGNPAVFLVSRWLRSTEPDWLVVRRKRLCGRRTAQQRKEALLKARLSDDPESHAFCEALSEGAGLREIVWLHSGGMRSESPDPVAVAARLGNLAAVEWMRAHDFSWGAEAIMEAAKHGHLEVVQWLFARGLRLTATYRGPFPSLVCPRVLAWVRANAALCGVV